MSNQEIKLVDLRHLCRDTSTCVCYVTLLDAQYRRTLWIKLGQVSLRKFGDRGVPWWWLEAYMTAGVTDPEHDSAYALKLPLVGVTFGDVHYHQQTVKAIIAPHKEREFHVPPPGYAPKTWACWLGSRRNSYAVLAQQ